MLTNLLQTKEQQRMQRTILELRDHYLSTGKVSSFWQINNGLCVEFAEEIESLIPGADHTSSDFYVMNLDEGWNADGNDRWDESLLVQANSYPPAPYTLETANQIEGYHRWIVFEGKHYDAECPEGVVNFFNLPFFHRWLESRLNK